MSSTRRRAYQRTSSSPQSARWALLGTVSPSLTPQDTSASSEPSGTWNKNQSLEVDLQSSQSALRQRLQIEKDGGVASLALHLQHLGIESKAHAEACLTWYNWIEGSAASMTFSDGFRRDAQSIRADWQGRASAEKDSLPPNPETVLRAVYDNKVMELTDRIHQLEAQAATHQDKTNASYVNIPVADPGNPTASLLERRLYKAAPVSSPEAAAASPSRVA